MGVSVREKTQGSGEWWVFVAHQGRRFSRKIGKKKLATEISEKIKAKLLLGEVDWMDQTAPMNFRAFAREKWLNGYVRTGLKKSTYRGYKIILDQHLIPEFGKLNLDQITRDRVRDFLVAKSDSGLSAARISRIRAALSGIFRIAIEDGHIAANPTAGTDRYLRGKDQHMGRRIPAPYTEWELKQYLSTAQETVPDYYPFFLTLARTGLRVGEALALKWADVNFSLNLIEIKRALVDNKITTPKSGKTRFVKISPQLAESLWNLKQQGKSAEWVFVNESGNPPNPANIHARVHTPVTEIAGLRRIRLHDFRHTYATLRIAKGHNIADVSRSLGHAKIGITINTYYHWMHRNDTGVEDLDD